MGKIIFCSSVYSVARYSAGADSRLVFSVLVPILDILMNSRKIPLILLVLNLSAVTEQQEHNIVDYETQ